jgi:hypothetical protein
MLAAHQPPPSPDAPGPFETASPLKTLHLLRLRPPWRPRFGKLVEIHFNATHQICGARIRTYLLEKSRVVGPQST